MRYYKRHVNVTRNTTYPFEARSHHYSLQTLSQATHLSVDTLFSFVVSKYRESLLSICKLCRPPFSVLRLREIIIILRSYWISVIITAT